MGIVWRRPVPTLRIKDPVYQEKMAQIEAALARCDTANPVFYEDDESQAGGRLDVQSSAKAGLSHPGKMPSITWLAPSMQATEEYFTSAG
ncbi:hypothetical protein D3C78_1030200 [compost metagenome]